MTDPNTAAWPYQQTATRLRQMIAAGEIGPRLPSQRQLAELFDVAPMTVVRALQVLKDAGEIETVRGLGTFVRRSR